MKGTQNSSSSSEVTSPGDKHWTLGSASPSCSVTLSGKGLGVASVPTSRKCFTGSYLSAISPSLPITNNLHHSLLPSQLQNYRSQICLQSREGSGSPEGRKIEGERGKMGGQVLWIRRAEKVKYLRPSVV